RLRLARIALIARPAAALRARERPRSRNPARRTDARQPGRWGGRPAVDAGDQPESVRADAIDDPSDADARGEPRGQRRISPGASPPCGYVYDRADRSLDQLRGRARPRRG